VQQEALLRRIANSCERLVEVVEEVNAELDKALVHHEVIDECHAVLTGYESKLSLSQQSAGASAK
jgi:hypothetical protein